MAIVINYAGASIKKPGAYSRIRVAQGGAAQAQLGVLALVGEADDGDAFAAESGISAVTWGPDEFNKILDKYGSGQLVDAARMALAPSNDPQIVGGAQQIITLKTNQSVKAQLDLPPIGLYTNYVALLAKLDLDGSVTDTNYASILTPLGSLASMIASFNALLTKLDADAGVTDANYNSTLSVSGSATWALLAAGINLALAKLDADAGVTDVNYASTLAVAVASYGVVKAKKAGLKGNNLSVQIDNSAGKRIITIADALTGDSEVSSAIGGVAAMTLQITGGGVSAATLTINATQISTTVTGGSNISVLKSQFATIGQFVAFLNSQPNYVATVGTNQSSQPLSVLDRVSAVNVFSAPYDVLRNAADIKAFFDQSALADFTQAIFAGLPSVMAKVFMTSGALGASTNANIQTCIDELSKVRINFMVPLFSRDASSDVTDSLTDASSTYTIDSIHTMVRTHVAQNSTIKGKKERQGFVGFDGSFANAKTKASNLGSARVSLHMQRVDIQAASGDLYTAQPHMLAVISAGMKSAAVVGLPNTFKLINVNGFSMASNDFDPETQADEAIDANITFVEKSPGGGFRWVLDNNTYGQVRDAWIYNRPSVMYAADTAAYAIRLNTETFVGQRNSDVTPETIKNLLLSVMDSLRSSGIIVPDASSGGKGFKDLTVSFTGSIINTSVTLILVEGFEFVLNDIQVARAVA